MHHTGSGLLWGSGILSGSILLYYFLSSILWGTTSIYCISPPANSLYLERIHYTKHKQTTAIDPGMATCLVDRTPGHMGHARLGPCLQDCLGGKCHTAGSVGLHLDTPLCTLGSILSHCYNDFPRRSADLLEIQITEDSCYWSTILMLLLRVLWLRSETIRDKDRWMDILTYVWGMTHLGLSGCSISSRQHCLILLLLQHEKRPLKAK